MFRTFLVLHQGMIGALPNIQIMVKDIHEQDPAYECVIVNNGICKKMKAFILSILPLQEGMETVKDKYYSHSL